MASYAWRCSICGEDFSPDKEGWLGIRDHAEEVHSTTPKESCLGVVDTETGEVMQPGWSPTVLAAARRRGYVADKDGQVRVDPKFRKPGDNSGGEVVSIDSAKGKKGIRLPTASMTVIAKNVAVDETVQLLFIQAMALYDYVNTPEDFSRFITEFMVIAAAEMGLDGAVIFTDLVEQQVAKITGNVVPATEPEGEGGDDE